MGSPPAPDFEPHEFQFRSAADPSPGGPFSDSDAGPLAGGGVCGGGGGGGGARYKLLSPAKLPISRSACITIPPGLSPTSFLESPVLLSNVKVEPSPTTGSLIKPHMMNGLIGSNSDTRLANSGCPDNFDEGRSGIFEFKPLATSSLVPTEAKHQGSEQAVKVSGQRHSQPFASLSSVQSDLAVSSKELCLSVPTQAVRSGASPLAEADPDGLLGRKEQPNNVMQVTQLDNKGNGPSVMTERLSDDGYNWRKYGQKHVKGCEFPRSYYKCTYPNCEVKKLFERAPDGHITEIIYKGTHDHPKPQPSRRFTGGATMPIQEERSDRFSFIPAVESTSTVYGETSYNVETDGTPELSPVAENDETIEGAASLSNRIQNEVDDGDDDDPFLKRRRLDIGGEDVTPVVKPIREPRVVVQTLSEVDILDDGYRWRKYGQKVVRGNPNPRSYYKCTNAGCPVRKHVERASHDPKAVITTYEGKHNHDVPAAKSSSHDTAAPSALSGLPRTRSEGETVSLDLGVGRSAASEMASAEKQQILRPNPVQSRIHYASSALDAVQATPVTAYHGFLNGGINQFGYRENLTEGHSKSTEFLQNMGRILTGP
ncbi:hypothetical protein ACJRO7_022836 [Eucalyptus globulus]|uniref:WRKY domain-containing protein n=1 Tax=Eucalyptus globulus TaxID=34317 RepID=A0ABD3K5P4_EUCGL